MIVKGRQAQRRGADAPLTDPQRPVDTGWLARTSCRVAGHTGDWALSHFRLCLTFGGNGVSGDVTVCFRGIVGCV